MATRALQAPPHLVLGMMCCLELDRGGQGETEWVCSGDASALMAGCMGARTAPRVAELQREGRCPVPVAVREHARELSTTGWLVGHAVCSGIIHLAAVCQWGSSPLASIFWAGLPGLPP